MINRGRIERGGGSSGGSSGEPPPPPPPLLQHTREDGSSKVISEVVVPAVVVHQQRRPRSPAPDEAGSTGFTVTPAPNQTLASPSCDGEEGQPASSPPASPSPNQRYDGPSFVFYCYIVIFSITSTTTTVYQYNNVLVLVSSFFLFRPLII